MLCWVSPLIKQKSISGVFVWKYQFGLENTSAVEETPAKNNLPLIYTVS